MKYAVHVTITRETGTRHPKPPKVYWSARRVVDPTVQIDGHELSYSTATEDDGILFGVYESVKHAEARGETLAYDDIGVEVEHVTLKLKRGNVDGANRHKVSAPHRSAYDEVMKRERPLK